MSEKSAVDTFIGLNFIYFVLFAVPVPYEHDRRPNMMRRAQIRFFFFFGLNSSTHCICIYDWMVWMRRAHNIARRNSNENRLDDLFTEF